MRQDNTTSQVINNAADRINEQFGEETHRYIDLYRDEKGYYVMQYGVRYDLNGETEEEVARDILNLRLL